MLYFLKLSETRRDSNSYECKHQKQWMKKFFNSVGLVKTSRQNVLENNAKLIFYLKFSFSFTQYYF